MNKKRLLKLAAFLETVPARKFYLHVWVKSMPKQAEGETEGSCGFAGCAMGWAVHAKLFRGLSFGESVEGDDDVNSPPMYNGEAGLSASSSLFGIANSESFYLFIDESYPNHKATPKQVAKRIRAFVASEGATS